MLRQTYRLILLLALLLGVITADFSAKPTPHKHVLNDNQQWIKLTVEGDGIYKVTAADLTNIGVTIPIEEVNTIKIFGTGGDIIDEDPSTSAKYTHNEQNILITKNDDGSFKELTFFGSGNQGVFYNKYAGEYIGFGHYNNCYTNDNSYILTFGGEESKEAVYYTQPEGEVINRPSTYEHVEYYEVDKYNPFDDQLGRDWFDDAPFTTNFTTQLYNLDRNKEIRYRFLFGQVYKSSAYIEVFENGTSLSKVRVYDSQNHYEAAGRGYAYISGSSDNIPSDGRSSLKFDYLASGVGIPYLDWFEILYMRSFVAIDNELPINLSKFDIGENEVTEITANGFSENMLAYDITDRACPTILTNNSSTGGIFKFKTKVPKGGNAKQFYISGKTSKPKLKIVKFANLTAETKGYDIIAIYHKDFKEAVDRYIEYRNEQGRFTAVATDIEMIYNEFGTGKKDLGAVRNYLAFAYKNWQHTPRFVLLMGDGHADFRNINTKVTNYIPVYQKYIDRKSTVLNSDYGAVASPDFLMSVGDTSFQKNIALGRLPVRTLAEANITVDKIIHYEANEKLGSWQESVLMFADDSTNDAKDDGAGDYIASSESIIFESMPDFMSVKRMYSPAYPTEKLAGSERRKPAMEAAMLSEINLQGAIIANYVGHGNPRVWSHEEWMERSRTIPQMINYDKLFFSYAATCDYGRFDPPDVQAGAELLITSAVGGAIGVIAGTRPTHNTPNERLGHLLYKNLFTIDSTIDDYMTMGEALLKAKQISGKSGNAMKYILFGDPAVSLNFPRHDIALDSFAGVDVSDTDTIITVKSLERVSLSGHVEELSKSTMRDFNGVGVLTIYDGDIAVETIDDMNKKFKWTEYGGKLNNSLFKIKNGKFETEIIIPKDISYSENHGRLFLFAYDEETGKTAKTVFNNIKIYGIEENATIDEKGPEINICLDYDNFQEGDYVSSSPTLMLDLFDESGINTTGIGIGHKIEAWVDDEVTPIDLTHRYVASIEDYRKGSIDEILNELDEGVHHVKVRAWDIYNNFSVAETYFRVRGTANGVKVLEMMAYPNPTEGPISISFEHTATPPYNVKVKIYNLMGMLVREFEQPITTLRYAKIDWDGLDKDGNQPAQGTYYYNVEINEHGKTTISSGTFILHR